MYFAKKSLKSSSFTRGKASQFRKWTVIGRHMAPLARWGERAAAEGGERPRMSAPQPRRAPAEEDASEGSGPPAPSDEHAVQPTSSGPLIKLSVLLCAYNNENTIVQAVGEVLNQQYPCDIELIVVDDGSTDATPTLVALIDDPRLTLHRHREHRGPGAALTTAIELASGTHMLPFDAELEYSAEDIPRIAEPVFKGRCDTVYGTRMFGYNTVYRSYRHAVGNRILTGVMNFLFNSCLSDLQARLKLIPLDMARQFNLRETGAGVVTEMTAMLLRTGERPFEVPISYYSSAHSHARRHLREVISSFLILWRVRLMRAERLQVPADRVRIKPGYADTNSFPEVAGQAAQIADSHREGESANVADNQRDSRARSPDPAVRGE